MERFNALGRGAQLMLVGAVLLFIDLFLPWQDFDVGGLADELGVDATFSGWRGIGFIVGLLTIVVLAWLIVRLASVDIPLPVSTAMTGALLGTLILVFTIIKLLTILGDEATIWAWLGVALAILIAVGAFMTVQEAGGVETLKSEATSYGGSAEPDAAAPARSGGAPAPAAAAPPTVEAQPAPTAAESAADEATEAASDATTTSRRPGGRANTALLLGEAAAQSHAPRPRRLRVSHERPANLAFPAKASTL